MTSNQRETVPLLFCFRAGVHDDSIGSRILGKQLKAVWEIRRIPGVKRQVKWEARKENVKLVEEDVRRAWTRSGDTRYGAGDTDHLTLRPG